MTIGESLRAVVLPAGVLAAALASQVPAPPPGPNPRPVAVPTSSVEAAAKWAAADFAAGRAGRIQVMMSNGQFFSGRVTEIGPGWVVLTTMDGKTVWINTALVLAVIPWEG